MEGVFPIFQTSPFGSDNGDTRKRRRKRLPCLSGTPQKHQADWGYPFSDLENIFLPRGLERLQQLARLSLSSRLDYIRLGSLFQIRAPMKNPRLGDFSLNFRKGLPASSAAAAESSVAAVKSAAARTGFLRASFVDCDCPSVELFAIEHLNSFLGFCIG